jgi:spore protease
MAIKRTDLAQEARDLWKESAGETTKLEGVAAFTETANGYRLETLKILDAKGEKALNKPVGTYITIDLEGLIEKEEGAFSRGVGLIAERLRKLMNLNKNDSVFVAGLGNSAITPDDLGPKTARYTMATRHLVDGLPEHFGSFRRVSVFETGVMGTTGVESAELIAALNEKLHPNAIIAVDALASRRLGRICRTVQIADTGITPGSGVGNARAEITKASMGIPVYAIGVPTVVDAATLAADLTEMANVGSFQPEDFGQYGRDMIVTPREIDSYIEDISKLIGYSINMALHDGLTIDDVNLFLS